VNPGMPELNRSARWRARLAQRRARVAETPSLVVEGQLTRMVGLTLEAAGCVAPVGSRCLVVGPDGGRVEAEVVGFAGGKLFLMPSGDIHGLMPNSRVIPAGGASQMRMGESLLGRVLDGAGRFLDGLPPPPRTEWASLTGKTINPLLRKPIREPLDVGVRAINALMSVGRGQRMGLFAGSGVGKSVLLGMMTRFTNAEVVVVGLIGERGREVQEFIQEILGSEGMARAVVVAAPADDPPLRRLQGAALATRIAEYFRDSGRQVLLLMDSLTRYAQAQREIALNARSRWLSASRRRPKAIRRRCSPRFRNWWSGLGTIPSAVPSPLFIPCWSRAMTRMIPSPMRPAPFSTGMWCCRGGWLKPDTIRRLTLKLQSAG